MPVSLNLIENITQFYVGISLSMSTIENIVIENIEFCLKNHIFVENSTIDVAACAPTLC
jgi:hypothetical protein